MKKLKKIKLEKVNGGVAPGDVSIVCTYCGNKQPIESSPTRTTGSGCDEEYEYQCNKCSQWFKFDTVFN